MSSLHDARERIAELEDALLGIQAVIREVLDPDDEEESE